MQTVRAKFKLSTITEGDWNPTARQLQFYAVSDDGIPENARYHKYTPAGQLNITVDNPSALEMFKIGKNYYLDFTLADIPTT
jgi:hypothetical protein